MADGIFRVVLYFAGFLLFTYLLGKIYPEIGPDKNRIRPEHHKLTRHDWSVGIRFFIIPWVLIFSIILLIENSLNISFGSHLGQGIFLFSFVLWAAFLLKFCPKG